VDKFEPKMLTVSLSQIYVSDIHYSESSVLMKSHTKLKIFGQIFSLLIAQWPRRFMLMWRSLSLLKTYMKIFIQWTSYPA